MNDSLLFLALATIFGFAMFVVGVETRRIREEREVRAALRKWADEIDETDSAGA